MILDHQTLFGSAPSPRVKPQPTPANAGQLLRAAARRATLAVIGQPWLELELAMGFEPTRATLPGLENKLFDATVNAKCD